MKGWVKEFYKEHKPVFEFCGVILVVTGLFLNIPNPTSYLGNISLHYVKFFLLLLSCVSVGYLIALVRQELTNYVLRDADRSDFEDTIVGMQKHIDFLAGRILTVVFLLLISLLILINLAVFIFDTYTTELAYITIVTVSYLLAYKSRKLVEKASFLNDYAIYFYIVWMLCLVLILPIGLFILMYFGLHEQILNYVIQVYCEVFRST